MDDISARRDAGHHSSRRDTDAISGGRMRVPALEAELVFTGSGLIGTAIAGRHLERTTASRPVTA